MRFSEERAQWEHTKEEEALCGLTQTGDEDMPPSLRRELRSLDERVVEDIRTIAALRSRLEVATEDVATLRKDLNLVMGSLADATGLLREWLGPRHPDVYAKTQTFLSLAVPLEPPAVCGTCGGRRVVITMGCMTPKMSPCPACARPPTTVPPGHCFVCVGACRHPSQHTVATPTTGCPPVACSSWCGAGRAQARHLGAFGYFYADVKATGNPPVFCSRRCADSARLSELIAVLQAQLASLRTELGEARAWRDNHLCDRETLQADLAAALKREGEASRMLVDALKIADGHERDAREARERATRLQGLVVAVEACASCGDEDSEVCPKSKRPCGHHCNHSWSHDVCDWCGKEWGEQTEGESNG